MLPVVLHHGFCGYDRFAVGPLKWSYFHKIDEAIEAAGYPLILPRVHPTGSIARRAAQLKDIIQQRLAAMGRGGGRFVIIAHSMGGLDARYMISRLGMDAQAAALLTVTTPHRGSPYADWCCRHVGQRLGAFALLDALGVDMEGARDLTTEACAGFNECVRDVPHVRYYSISACRPIQQVAPVFYLSHHIISQADGDNDGLVSVRSARWGRHLETWAADHMLAVGRRMLPERSDAPLDVPRRYLEALQAIHADERR